jgi:hypothetical protein
MDRGDAYKVLVNRLEEIRREGFERLVARVGQGVVSETIWFGGEPVEIVIEISWDGQQMRKVRVRGSALGPSSWTIERLDESFVVGPTAGSEG